MNYSLKIQKTILKNVNAVYNAFVNPKTLSAWFTTNAKVDLRAGGRYSNDDFDEGKYLEIKHGKKLKFTWENKSYCPGTVVTIFFDKKEKNKTRVRLVHSLLKTKEHVESMRAGWKWALFNVKLFLEIGKTITHEEWLKSQK